MTDRFALAYAERAVVPWRGSRTRRSRRSSRGGRHGRGRRAAARTLRKAGRALHGPLPVPRGADAELLGQPGRQALLLLRLRQGRRRDHVRPRDREPRLRRRDRVARRPLPRPARVRGGLAADEDARGAGASGCSRCSTRRRRSTSATCGSRRPASRCATYLASRGLGEAVCREFRLGLAPADDARARRRGSGASPPTSCARPGSSTAAATTTSRGGCMFPLADARGRVVGFQARQAARGRPAARRSTSTRPRASSSTRRTSSTASTCARTAIAKQERAVVVEGNTDVIALRQAGFEPVVASMGTALTERQLRELRRLDAAALPLLRRRRGRRGGDAARDGARGRRRGSTCASCRCRRGRIRPTRRRVRGSGSRGAESYLVYRVRLELDRASDRQEAFVRARERCSRTSRTRPSGRTRCGCSPTGSTCRGRRWPASRRDRAAWRSPSTVSPNGARGRATGSSATRSPACVAHPPLVQAAWPSSRPTTSTRAAPALPRACSWPAGQPTRSWSALLAELDARAAREGIDERTGKELLLRLRERRLRRELARRRARAGDGAPGAARAHQGGDPGAGLERAESAVELGSRSAYDRCVQHRGPFGFVVGVVALTVAAVTYAVLTLPAAGEAKRPVQPFARWAEQHAGRDGRWRNSARR